MGLWFGICERNYIKHETEPMKFTEAKLEAAFIDLLARVDMLSTQDGPRGSACCHPAKTDIFTAWKGLN